MAPVRRYLRITKYSVLELRIYLENPALVETWLLRRADPALPQIIEAIRPHVLPKLREENERAKRAGKKTKGSIKSSVKQDDFEVSFFLIRQTSPHSLLTKRKDFTDKPRLKSNSNKLTSWLTTGTSGAPIVVNDGPTDNDPIAIREESDDEVNMADIPEAPVATDYSANDDDDGLFVSDSEPNAPRKRAKAQDSALVDEPDSKKKLALALNYDGFSIYGHILCLIVKRIGGTAAAAAATSSQQMMENWVSTQVQREEEGLVEVDL